MTQTGWATLADVTSLTGATLTGQPALDQANAAIELHAGRIYTIAADRTGSRDTEWMRRACVYQAVWMASQPDVFTRLDYTEVAKETGAATKVTATAMTLAPLARKALARVSWLKSRSVHVRTPFTDGLGPVSTAIIDYDDGEGGF